MNEKKQEALRKYTSAVARLSEAIAEQPSKLQADAVIKRFEFTFELLWKTLKIFLEDLGIQTRSPKETLKAAFKQGWIQDEQAYLEMLEDRNRTTHVYDQAEADAIFKDVAKEHLSALTTMQKLLEGKL